MNKTKIAVVGGDARKPKPDPKGTKLLRFSSQRDGGNKDKKRILEKLKNGTLEIVFVFTGKIGHSMAGQVTKACKKTAVKYFLINGGESELRKTIERILTEEE